MPNPGDIIGKHYQIVNTLGRGGFGITYLVKDIFLPHQPKFVAKQLQPQYNSPVVWEKAKERFAKEALTLRRLGTHGQIPQLIDYFEENQDFYLIQEFIDGEELRREVSRRILSECEVLAFLADALGVLRFVHQQNVIHRDIKPSNLLRRRTDGKIILIDFGAVKEIENFALAPVGVLSDQTSAIGSPGYMPLEQQGGRPNFSSDIYALGQTAIFAVTGRAPIDLEATATGDTGSWQAEIPVSPALRSILIKMTESRATLRYQTTDEVLQDLHPLQRVGQTLGDRYQLLDYLGGQGWTHTYRAEALKLDIPGYCVVKQMKSGVKAAISAQEIEQRFQQVCAIFQQLGQHPQFPCLRDQFELEGDRFLVEDYIEGESLTQILKIERKLSESNIIKVLEEVLEALEFIHQKGIIHQDIRPSNLIWQASDQKIVLIDLGWVTDVSDVLPDSIQLWTENDSLENRSYRAPEQLLGNPTFASDLYALGITAIQSLMGDPPDRFPRDPQTGELRWQEELSIDSQLAMILDKLVQPELSSRYKSASEALKDVAQLKLKYQSAYPVLKPPRFSRWQRVLAMGIGIGAIIGAISYVNQVSYTIWVLENAEDNLNQKDYRNAIKLYNDGLAHPPLFADKIADFERAWIQKALAFSALKRYPDMLKACERAAFLDQTSPHPYICQGTALDEMGKPELAIKSYDRAIAVNPNLFEAWQGRGHSYLKLANPQKAIADFQKAIALGKNKASVTWNDLGSLYLTQKNYAKAIEAYQQAINIAASYLPARIGLGNALIAHQKYEAAKSAFKQALALDQKSYEAWYGLARVEERLRNYPLALSSYRQALTLKPNYSAALAAEQRISPYVK